MTFLPNSRMSHTFHGKKPSLNKIEKAQNQVMDEMYMKRVSGVSVAPTLRALQFGQEQGHSAHVVLSSKKAGVYVHLLGAALKLSAYPCAQNTGLADEGGAR